MKLFFELCKMRILNCICGSSFTNTKIRNLIVIHFIKSIQEKSIIGNRDTNQLLYDTMYTIYLSAPVYSRKSRELVAIVYATAKEFERILKTKVDPKKYPNYNQSHSPYWQFVFQDAPIGARVANADVTEEFFRIDSDTFPAGRDSNTSDTEGVISIRSIRSAVQDVYINKDAFVGVEKVCEGEFVIPFGMLYSTNVPMPNRQVTYLTLTIKNASFLVNGGKTSTFQMTTNELYIAGKNASDNHNGAPVLRIADNHVMNPQVHITYLAGTIRIDANGDVSYRNRRISNTNVEITRGSSILINQAIQIVIR